MLWRLISDFISHFGMKDLIVIFSLMPGHIFTLRQLLISTNRLRLIPRRCRAARSTYKYSIAAPPSWSEEFSQLSEVLFRFLTKKEKVLLLLRLPNQGCTESQLSRTSSTDTFCSRPYHKSLHTATRRTQLKAASLALSC